MVSVVTQPFPTAEAVHAAPKLESRPFALTSDFAPAGDQPQAIQQLVSGLQAGEAGMTLLGVTGSGKTFTIANVIEQVQRPTLILAHNKTLAAQLYQGMRKHDLIWPQSRQAFRRCESADDPR